MCGFERAGIQFRFLRGHWATLSIEAQCRRVIDYTRSIDPVIESAILSRINAKLCIDVITATPGHINKDVAISMARTYLGVENQDLLDLMEYKDAEELKEAPAAPTAVTPPSLDQMAEQWVKIFGSRKGNAQGDESK